MDASRGDLIGVLADPYGHEPEPPGDVGPAVPAGRAGGGRGSQQAGRSPNAAAAAGLVIIGAVAAAGVLAGQGFAHNWAVPATVLPLALSLAAGVLLVGYWRRLGWFSGQGGDQAGTLSRLSDRDELAARLQSASRVLSDVAA